MLKPPKEPTFVCPRLLPNFVNCMTSNGKPVLCRDVRDSDKGRGRVTSHNVVYTCATCMQVWKWAPYLHVDIEAGVRCKHAEGRSENLKSGSTRQFFRKRSAALQPDLCKVWKLSATEKEIIHLVGGSPGEALRKLFFRFSFKATSARYSSHRALSMENACRAKVVEEGIGPHPGPSSLPLLSLIVAGFSGFVIFFWKRTKADAVALQELSFTQPVCALL